VNIIDGLKKHGVGPNRWIVEEEEQQAVMLPDCLLRPVQTPEEGVVVPHNGVNPWDGPLKVLSHACPHMNVPWLLSVENPP
jgi:hypothetical protein